MLAYFINSKTVSRALNCALIQRVYTQTKRALARMYIVLTVKLARVFGKIRRPL